MIRFEHTKVIGWEHAIRGMRNPMNSWEKSDSYYDSITLTQTGLGQGDRADYHVGPNDLDLMKRLRNAGTDHRKFMRMITVYVDITAPLYWWKEYDTYKVGTVANSCSTMHKIAAKAFTLEDFSHEHLIDEWVECDKIASNGLSEMTKPKAILEQIIFALNVVRDKYLETKDKKYWWQMIQLLPSSYNQKRTVMMNYEVLANIYKSRKNHKLDEWCEHKPEWDFDAVKPRQFSFCDWIKTLPYSELITGEV